ncbi:MAG TPA: EamA family transporter [Vicinamibacterales bacterium]|nr:EamA family transporter [Vicinamibacterales bacterium]HPW21485.1 EamA family transporter [Vicinamibacterales bacterium]
MAARPGSAPAPRLSLHRLGVVCGLAAGAGLGAAEAPTKLVTTGLSPFLISLGMVAGVFVARWTVPMVLKGGDYVWADLREKPHLVVWAILAGMIWAVANTLTVFAIRDVGLSIAFPLWNTNSLVGLFWGWLLFRELRDAGAGQWGKVLGGATAIVVGACLTAYATAHQAPGSRESAAMGIAAALMAGLLWGTMYIPYRKAYISGMNPLSFVTVFTFAELGTVLVLAAVFEGGLRPLAAALAQARPALFWLFLGGFCWVLGDLYQQYAAKYVGIGRGIPLSNTNQLWGLAWGALVFGEFAGLGAAGRALIVSGSLIMIAGAIAISLAEAPTSERAEWRAAMRRECDRYGLDPAALESALHGEDRLAAGVSRRRTWEYVVAALAVALFVWLASFAERPQIPIHGAWTLLLGAITALVIVLSGVLLYRRTQFS